MWWALWVQLAVGASRADRASELAFEAYEAYQENDGLRARKLANRALRLDPDEPTANVVDASVLLFTVGEMLKQRLDPQQTVGLQQIASEQLLRIAEIVHAQPPGSPASELAQRVLSAYTQTKLVPDYAHTCSAEAEAAHERAEARFSARDFAGAIEHYEASLKLCPDNALWHVFLGDARFGLKDNAGASGSYRRAIELEPCIPQGHRFLSHVYAGEGRMMEALSASAAAVVCNPEYELGWAWLRKLSANKPIDGLQRPRKPAGPGPALGAEWAAYVAVRFGDTPLRGLERERAAVRAGLDAGSADSTGLTWRLLRSAEGAGVLDGAIYLLLLDEDLLSDFLSWRAAPTGRDQVAGWVALQVLSGAAGTSSVKQ